MKLYKNHTNSRNAAYKEKHEQMEFWMSLMDKEGLGETSWTDSLNGTSWTESLNGSSWTEIVKGSLLDRELVANCVLVSEWEHRSESGRFSGVCN